MGSTPIISTTNGRLGLYGSNDFLFVNMEILLKSFGIVKAVLLSVIPSLTFIFSGVIIASMPLFSFSIIFAVSHILISVKNSNSGYLSQKSVNDVAPDKV